MLTNTAAVCVTQLALSSKNSYLCPSAFSAVKNFSPFLPAWASPCPLWPTTITGPRDWKGSPPRIGVCSRRDRSSERWLSPLSPRRKRRTLPCVHRGDVKRFLPRWHSSMAQFAGRGWPQGRGASVQRPGFRDRHQIFVCERIRVFGVSDKAPVQTLPSIRRDERKVLQLS